MIVNEVFYSLQGEGRLAGMPSVFVRIAGCPLHCAWCDTKYAWASDAGEEMTPSQLLERTGEHPTRHVVFTGGEPMVQPGFAGFLKEFHRPGMHITIETAGTEHIPDLPCDLMSISPKLSNAGNEGPQAEGPPGYRPEVIRRLIDEYEYQLKFVVDEPADLDEIAACLEELDGVDPDRVMLMPQATTPGELLAKSTVLADFCCRTGFAMSQRLHVLLWGGRRGK